MRERGKYQIQCMKSRSSTGVGQKIDLDYNIETMRITDPGPEGQDSNTGGHGGYKPSANILSQIKASTTLTPSGEVVDTGTGEISTPGSSVESNKLKQMLAGLKSKA
jgi:hypothetical protein